MDQKQTELLRILQCAPNTEQENDDSSDYASSDSELSDDESKQVLLKEKLSEDYENEIEEDLTKAYLPQKKPKRPRKLQSKIPAHLKGLMGEANLRFARGDFDTAEHMCFELIRQAPYAHEPYVSLSQLYESTHPEKSMQYLTIAAHLNPSNSDQWLRLAQINIESNRFKTAVTCFTKAVKAQPKNVELHLKRIKLLEALGDHKFALRCKVRVLQAYSRKHPELIMIKAKELAEIFHKEKDYAKACDVFSVPFTKCREHVTPEMINIYLELLLLNRSYSECLDIFVQHCNVEIEVMFLDDNKLSILSYTIPESIQIDLRIKFIICLIHLEAYALIEELLVPLIGDEANVEVIGDLYLDVAEALMFMKRFEDALRLLIPLIKSKNFSLAAVWLKHAECLKECQMYEHAIDSYYNVIRLAPQHIEVRYPLSELLLNANREHDALEVLNQDFVGLELDVGLLLKRMELLKSLNYASEFCNSVELLLKRHCIVPIHEEEFRVVMLHDTVYEKINRINKSREFRGEELYKQEIISLREPDIEEEYKIFHEALNYCYHQKRYPDLQKFAFMALSSSRFKSYSEEIMLIAFYACLFNRNLYTAFPMVREFIVRRNNNHNLIWNLFNITLQNSDDFRHNRFLMRQAKVRNGDFLKILEANNALAAGSYKIATIHLVPMLKNKPTPLIYLLLGVVFLQVSCQKHRDVRKKLTQLSYGLFLNYGSNRGKLAYNEVAYNLGRLYHQFGILHLAAFYYNQVLGYENDMINKYPHILCLKREAAFNLLIIYKDSGNLIGARNLMIKYLTI